MALERRAGKPVYYGDMMQVALLRRLHLAGAPAADALKSLSDLGWLLMAGNPRGDGRRSSM